jgi:hypothetical protein
MNKGMNMITQYEIELDWVGNESCLDFLTHLAHHNARVQVNALIGPAGGNPCLLFTFTNKEDAISFLKDYSPDEWEYLAKEVLRQVS